MKTRAYRSFLPTPRNQERLAFAEKLDLNISELINEVLDITTSGICSRRGAFSRAWTFLPWRVGLDTRTAGRCFRRLTSI